jgi:hypothetical protein
MRVVRARASWVLLEVTNGQIECRAAEAERAATAAQGEATLRGRDQSRWNMPGSSIVSPAGAAASCRGHGIAHCPSRYGESFQDAEAHRSKTLQFMSFSLAASNSRPRTGRRYGPQRNGPLGFFGRVYSHCRHNPLFRRRAPLTLHCDN